MAARGDEALTEYTQRFDCPDFTPAQLRVPEAEIKGAARAIPAEDLDILRQAADNIRTFHQAQLRQSWWTTRPDGTVLGQMVTPVDRAGLYVPGGRGGETPLVSSLLMNAVPAQVAGVGEVALASPPRKDGSLNEYILAAAELLGITEVYRLGSAWAVAALALGTGRGAGRGCHRGPGQHLRHHGQAPSGRQVGIDMIAGPSEIVVLADATADPAWLAADMLSQAEHDPLASALLVTPDPALAQGALKALEEQRDKLPRSDIAKESLANWGAVVVVPDMERGVELVNRLAPEHLELALEDPWTVVPLIRHAGAVFMGSHTPEAVGTTSRVPTTSCPPWERPVSPRPSPWTPSARKRASSPLLPPLSRPTETKSPGWPDWKDWKPTPGPWSNGSRNRAESHTLYRRGTHHAHSDQNRHHRISPALPRQGPRHLRDRPGTVCSS